MTGQGEGRVEFSGGGFLVAEVRSVNNRHLKIHSRLGEGLGFMESALDALLRSKVRRGSINVNVSWHGRQDVLAHSIRPKVVLEYLEQIRSISRQLDVAPELRWSDLLALPGVFTETLEAADQEQQSEKLADSVIQALEVALNELNRMRSKEGELMAEELRRQLEQLRQVLLQIDGRAPEVIAEHRLRLKQRVTAAIEEATEFGSSDSIVQDASLIREVAILSDRVDIREEIVRLRSHFVQTEELLSGTESQGRKLDFLIQEMFRESNTIGSKASDALISRCVVELKAILEQMRELVQNVE